MKLSTPAGPISALEQLTIRGFDPEIGQRLERRARERSLSLNRAIDS